MSRPWCRDVHVLRAIQRADERAITRCLLGSVALLLTAKRANGVDVSRESADGAEDLLAADVKIAVKDVTCTYVDGKEEVQALGPINLEIHDGEFVCLIGPSGCGKSTLLRMVGGLSLPSSGEVDLRVADPARATATVFQDYSIYPWKNVQSNVRFGLDLAGVPKREGNDRAKTYLDRLGIGDRAKAYPSALSGGMKQRVAIARALAVEPDILLMDEPFSAIDAQMRHVLQDQLLSIWQADRRTVLFVTHSIEEAILLADRVVMLSNRPGQIIADRRVDIERPRDAVSARSSKQFAELHDELWELMRGEVQRHLAESGDLMGVTQ